MQTTIKNRTGSHMLQRIITHDDVADRYVQDEFERAVGALLAEITGDGRAYFVRVSPVIVDKTPDRWGGTEAHYTQQIDVALLDWRVAKIGEVVREMPDLASGRRTPGLAYPGVVRFRVHPLGWERME